MELPPYKAAPLQASGYATPVRCKRVPESIGRRPSFALPSFLVASLLLEIVYNDLRKKRPTLLHEFQVLGMILVFVLGLFALEVDVQCHLIGLINYLAMATCHSSDVEIHNARN